MLRQNKSDTLFLAFQIDIEEAEFSEGGFTNWINSGALDNVRQIALELHIYQNEENPK